MVSSTTRVWTSMGPWTIRPSDPKGTWPETKTKSPARTALAKGKGRVEG